MVAAIYLRMKFKDGGTLMRRSGLLVAVATLVALSAPAAHAGIVFTGLGTLGGVSRPTGVSADGSVVVVSIPPRTVFRWTFEPGSGYPIGSPVEIPIPGREFGATAISADGSVVVGWSQWWRHDTREAFRWTEAPGDDPDAVLLGGMREGPLVPPWWYPWELFVSPNRSSAKAVSADGSVVVGQAWPWSEANFEFDSENGYWREISSPDPHAFVWDEAIGMRSLQELLIHDYALGDALTGWSLSDATGISADGRTIVGYGTNPSGEIEAWLVRLPAAPAEIPVPAALPLFITALAGLAFFGWRSRTLAA